MIHSGYINKKFFFPTRENNIKKSKTNIYILLYLIVFDRYDRVLLFLNMF